MKPEKPTIEHRPDDLHADSIERHPSYCQISASRVSGHAALYGSDFNHQHYMTITIRRSELTRNLSTNWPHATPRALVSIAMSEAQWATFVSTANVGFGVQCTLQDFDGQSVPRIERDAAPRSTQFAEELKAKMREADDALDALRAKLDDAKLSGKARDELVDLLGRVRSSYRSGMPFVAQQFDEHIEETTEKARIEISAYAQALIQQTGLTALASPPSGPLALPVIELPGGKDE